MATPTASNGSSTPAFNGRDVAAYFKHSWSSTLERANDPKLPAAEKPEIFKAPAGPGGAWSAWGNRAANANMADGQSFTAGLGKALQQYNQAATKQT